jgi:tetratricopeptide (TPR) repeat protein
MDALAETNLAAKTVLWTLFRVSTLDTSMMQSASSDHSLIHLTQALTSSYPDRERTWWWLGIAYRLAGDCDAAMNAWQRVDRNLPISEEVVWANLAFCSIATQDYHLAAERGQNLPGSGQFTISRAEAAATHGDTVLALRWLDLGEMVSEVGSQEHYLADGLVHEYQGDWARSLEIYSEAAIVFAKADMNRFDFRARDVGLRGREEAKKKGDSVQWRRISWFMLLHWPDDYWWMFANLAEDSFAKKDYASALTAVERAEKISAEARLHADGWRARIACQQGQYSAAESYFDRAADPDYPYVVLWRAECYHLQGRREEALGLFDNWLPTHRELAYYIPSGLMEVGDWYLEAQQPERAVETWQLAISLEPTLQMGNRMDLLHKQAQP